MLFAPEGSAEGCASGECLPGEEAATATPASTSASPASPSAPPLSPSEVEGRPAPSGPVSRSWTSSPNESNEAEAWRQAVEAVRSKSPRHGKSLSSARFLGFTADKHLRIAFPPNAAFHRSAVFGTGRSMIEEELSAALGRPTKLVEETDTRAIAKAPQSLAEEEAQAQAERSSSIEGRVRAHPALKNVLKVLGGQVEHIQILEETPTPAAPSEPDVPAPVEDDN